TREDILNIIFEDNNSFNKYFNKLVALATVKFPGAGLNDLQDCVLGAMYRCHDFVYRSKPGERHYVLALFCQNLEWECLDRIKIRRSSREIPIDDLSNDSKTNIEEKIANPDTLSPEDMVIAAENAAIAARDFALLCRELSPEHLEILLVVD